MSNAVIPVKSTSSLAHPASRTGWHRSRGWQMYKLLDLFCGAGGAGAGYRRSGFHVTGVDIAEQARYAGDVFVQADALEYACMNWHRFDVIHASPPCQRYSTMN
ncbi:MAG: DNA cytosine methyltransferase, partial [Chloroflexota bacterium]